MSTLGHSRSVMSTEPSLRWGPLSECELLVLQVKVKQEYMCRGWGSRSQLARSGGTKSLSKGTRAPRVISVLVYQILDPLCPPLTPDSGQVRAIEVTLGPPEPQGAAVTALTRPPHAAQLLSLTPAYLLHVLSPRTVFSGI